MAHDSRGSPEETSAAGEFDSSLLDERFMSILP